MFDCKLQQLSFLSFWCFEDVPVDFKPHATDFKWIYRWYLVRSNTIDQHFVCVAIQKWLRKKQPRCSACQVQHISRSWCISSFSTRCLSQRFFPCYFVILVTMDEIIWLPMVPFSVSLFKTWNLMKFRCLFPIEIVPCSDVQVVPYAQWRSCDSYTRTA